MMRGVATIGDFFDGLSGGCIKPLISRQVLANMAFEVTLDITKARDQLGYRPVITIEEGMSELKSRYLEASTRSRSDVN